MRTCEQFSFEDIQGFRFGYSPLSKPFIHANVYFVDGLLIDTGQRKVSQLLLDKIGGLAVEQIFITHHHEDHTGNLDHLQAHFSCPIYASPSCCEMMKAPPPISLAQQMSWGNRPPFHQLTPIKGTLRTPNHQFEIIPAPGHAPDMVVLYEPERKWLFSADLYIHHYIGYMLPSESITQQIQSTRRVLELDFDVLLCGHNPQFSNGKALLQQKLSFLEQFYEQVAKFHQKGLSAKAVFKAMRLKENHFIKIFSGGKLSKMNMVRSVIRDLSNPSPSPA